MRTDHSTVQRRGYKIRDAAEVLDVAQRTIHRLIADGELRTFRIGRAIRVRADDLDRIVVTGTSDGNGAATA